MKKYFFRVVVRPAALALFLCPALFAADTNSSSVLSVDQIMASEQALVVPYTSSVTSIASVTSLTANASSALDSNIYVSLRDCIVMGLAQNLGLVVERYTVPIAREVERSAISVFDPVFYGLAEWQGQKSPRPYEKEFITGGHKMVIGNADSQQTEFSGRIAGKFITGLDYSIASGNTRSWHQDAGGINPTFSTYTEGTLSVPLLKGFGLGVNLAPVRVARNNWRISQVQLESQMQDLITAIVYAYWNVYYAREQTSARQYSLQLAQELLSINQAKVNVGMAAPLDVTQAKASIARQEDGLLVAQNAVRNFEDNLRLIVNFEMDVLQRPKALRPIELHLVPLEKPEVVDVTYNEDDLLSYALQHHQTLAISSLQLANAKETTKVAKNNLLPQLNALGTLGYEGVGASFDGAYDDEYTARHPNWAAGLEVTVPLFYNDEIATYRQAKYGQRQSEITLEQVKQQITIDVRTATRNLATNRKRIDATRLATVFAREQLAAEREKFNVGQSTTFNVLDFQDKLATAISDEIQALVEWKKSIADLQKAVGKTLQVNNIVFDSYAAIPPEPKFIDDYIWR